MTIGTIIAKYGLPKTLSLCFERVFYAKRSKEMKAALFQILNWEVNHRRIGQLMPIFVCVLSLGACSGGRVVEQCGDYIEKGDIGRFEITEKGVAYDPNTNLYWSRCSVGQKLNREQCVGKAVAAPIDDAYGYVDEISEKSSRKWRIPNNAELSSIMEKKCINPAVNPNVFPNILVENYWTSEKSPHQMSGMFRCAGYTYQGAVSCRVFGTTQLPFLIVSDGS